MNDPKLLPNQKELKALRLFVSTDETRLNMNRLYVYPSDGGTTYFATDGHTMCIRRAGTHRTIPMYDIAKLPALVIDSAGIAGPTDRTPPAWPQLMKAGAVGKCAEAYSMNPYYFARLGDVERAVGARAAEDFVPRVGSSKKDQKKDRVRAKDECTCRVVIPSYPLDGWFWSLATEAARWEGVIMPRQP